MPTKVYSVGCHFSLLLLLFLFIIYTVFVKSYRFAVFTIFATCEQKKLEPNNETSQFAIKACTYRYIDFIENQSFLWYNFFKNRLYRVHSELPLIEEISSTFVHTIWSSCIIHWHNYSLLTFFSLFVYFWVCLRIFVFSNGHDFWLQLPSRRARKQPTSMNQTIDQLTLKYTQMSLQRKPTTFVLAIWIEFVIRCRRVAATDSQ